MKKLGETYNRIENILAAIGTIAGLTLIFINVVMRYVFHHPLAWTDEISVVILSWAIIIGFSIDLGERSHICMDVIYDAVKSPALRRAMDWFAVLIGLLYSVFITFYGGQAVALQVTTGRVYPITEFPRWVAYLIIVLAGIAMVGRYLIMLAQLLGKNREKGEEN